jgi:hypothetical protein
MSGGLIDWRSVRQDPLFWSTLLRPRVSVDGVVNGKAVMTIIRRLAKECELTAFSCGDMMDGWSPGAEDIASAELRVAMHMWTAVSKMQQKEHGEHVEALKGFCDTNTVGAIVYSFEKQEKHHASVKTMLMGKLKLKPQSSVVVN